MRTKCSPVGHCGASKSVVSASAGTMVALQNVVEIVTANSPISVNIWPWTLILKPVQFPRYEDSYLRAGYSCRWLWCLDHALSASFLPPHSTVQADSPNPSPWWSLFLASFPGPPPILLSLLVWPSESHFEFQIHSSSAEHQEQFCHHFLWLSTLECLWLVPLLNIHVVEFLNEQT